MAYETISSPSQHTAGSCSALPARLKAYGSERTPAPIQELQRVKTEESEDAPFVDPRTIRVLGTPSTSSMMTLATGPSSVKDSVLCLCWLPSSA